MPAVAGFGPDGDRDGWLAFLENAKKDVRAPTATFLSFTGHSYEKTKV